MVTSVLLYNLNIVISHNH